METTAIANDELETRASLTRCASDEYLNDKLRHDLVFKSDHEKMEKYIEKFTANFKMHLQKEQSLLCPWFPCGIQYINSECKVML